MYIKNTILLICDLRGYCMVWVPLLNMQTEIKLHLWSQPSIAVWLQQHLSVSDVHVLKQMAFEDISLGRRKNLVQQVWCKECGVWRKKHPLAKNCNSIKVHFISEGNLSFSKLHCISKNTTFYNSQKELPTFCNLLVGLKCFASL